MDKLIPIHFSLGDWDFDPDGKFFVASTQFVSAPSSLCTPLANFPANYQWLFLKTALGASIPQGRVITYERLQGTVIDDLWFYFRTQVIPINGFPANTYILTLVHSVYTLIQTVAGGNTSLKTGNLTYTRNAGTWYRHRLTFYTFINASLQTTLRVSFDTWVAGTWVQQFTWDIAPPLWEGSATNRIGFMVRGTSITNYHWLDDTEIWKRAV